MRKIFGVIYDNKLFLVMMMILLSYVGTIHSDYIVQDAFVEQSGEYVPVTEKMPVRTEISPTKNQGGWSVLLGLIKPLEPSGIYSTTVRVLRDEDIIYEYSMSNDADIEINDTLGNATEFVFDEAVETEEGKMYSVELTSSAPDASQAFSVALDESGRVWTRLTYRLLSKNQRKAVCFLIVFVLSAAVYYTFISNRTSKPETFFLAVSVPLCLLYMVAIPLFQAPDEVNHFVRAWGIVKGHFLIPEDGYLPVPDNMIPYSWYTYTPYILFKNFAMRLNEADTTPYNVVNMALYSPISYIFQSAGIAVGDLFHNTYAMVLLGRIFNAVGCTLILYYAIKYIPYGKGILVFFSLTPMAIQERASLSVDAITYCIVIALLSFCLYMRNNKVKMTGKLYALLYIILIILSSCKVVYFAAAVLCMVIPWECFGSKKRSTLHKILSMTVTGCLALGWLAIAGKYLENTRGGQSTQEKIHFILSSPGRYIYIMNKTIWENGEDFLYQMIGSKLGSLNIVINSLLILALLACLMKVYFYEKSHSKSGDFWAKFVLLGGSLGTVLLIFTSLYIQWTSYEASTYSIEGLQGRYFLPVMPLILCAMISDREQRGLKGGVETRTLLRPVFAVYVMDLIIAFSIFSYSSF